VGVDSPNAGIEWSAVYLQGVHTNTTIRGNVIVAAGEAGLMTEYGKSLVNFVVEDNTFSGVTFAGQPVGEGFENMWTEINSPRQLVVIQGSGGPVSFSRNVVSGTAGGLNPEGNPQGNTLVTVDTVNATIADNVFSGASARYATALRVGAIGAVVTRRWSPATCSQGKRWRVVYPDCCGHFDARQREQFHWLHAAGQYAIAYDGTAVVGATNNWFGSATGPASGSNAGGTGAAVAGAMTSVRG
jgi:hypothetical protein